MVPYAVAPVSDGGVQLEWRSSPLEIEVEVGPLGELGYLLIDGRVAERRFEEQGNVPTQPVLDLVTLLLTEPALLIRP
jgi:hypothetical protein